MVTEFDIVLTSIAFVSLSLIGIGIWLIFGEQTT